MKSLTSQGRKFILMEKPSILFVGDETELQIYPQGRELLEIQSDLGIEAITQLQHQRDLPSHTTMQSVLYENELAPRTLLYKDMPGILIRYTDDHVFQVPESLDYFSAVGKLVGSESLFDTIKDSKALHPYIYFGFNS